MQEKEIVYLAGKITGDPFYWGKFYKAQCKLEEAGYIVLNPAMLPKGLPYESCMKIDKAMQSVAHISCFLPDWKESEGGIKERGQAEAFGQKVMFFDEWEKQQEEAKAGQA